MYTTFCCKMLQETKNKVVSFCKNSEGKGKNDVKYISIAGGNNVH